MHRGGLTRSGKETARACGVAVAVALVCAVPALAQTYSDVYVFGDSLSDTGNTCTALAIGAYQPGRCSNGDVWSERFAETLGLEADASSGGGTNFAVGSAETTDLAAQIATFSLVELGSADPDALYAIWLGGNDVLELPGAPTAMQDAVDDIIDGIRSLQNLGAEHFLIANLPDIGRAYGTFSLPPGNSTLFSPGERNTATALSLDFNDRLEVALAGEPIETLFALDIEGLVEELFANPPAFGLSPAAIDTVSDDTDYGIPCLIDPGCAANPQGAVADTFFLFDSIHPTTAMHAQIADRAVALVVPEPTTASATAAVLLALVLLARRNAAREAV